MSSVSSQDEKAGQAVKRRYLPRELRIKAYDMVIRLRLQGMSYNKIIYEVYIALGVRLSKSHISYYVRGLHNPRNGIYISSLECLMPSEDLAFVIGAVIGDGTTKRTKSGDFVMMFRVKDKEFAEEFSKRIANVLGRQALKPRVLKDGRWAIEIKSKILYELLKKPIDIERIRPFVEHCEKCVGAFIRGFFDAEGIVRKDGTMTVVNTDFNLLLYVRDLLRKINVETTSEPKLHTPAGTSVRGRNGKVYKTRKDLYYLQIRKSSNENFYDMVGFTIDRKRKRLEEYLRRRKSRPASTTPIFSLFTPHLFFENNSILKIYLKSSKAL
ncbi:MAG: LAGLIDADG family homing endonuclease [Candidatus Caldarchaeum sp.]